MKTKEKFFLIEYPEEDVKKKEKEETKKQAAFSYEQEQKRKTPLNQILAEKFKSQYSEVSREDIHDNEEIMSKSNTRIKKPQSSLSREDHEDVILQKEDKTSSDNLQLNKSNKYTNNEMGTNRQLDVEEK